VNCSALAKRGISIVEVHPERMYNLTARFIVLDSSACHSYLPSKHN
jgi:hypothetical protein